MISHFGENIIHLVLIIVNHSLDHLFVNNLFR